MAAGSGEIKWLLASTISEGDLGRFGQSWARRLQLREAAGYQAGLPRLAMLRYPAENGAQERT